MYQVILTSTAVDGDSIVPSDSSASIISGPSLLNFAEGSRHTPPIIQTPQFVLEIMHTWQLL